MVLSASLIYWGAEPAKFRIEHALITFSVYFLVATVALLAIHMIIFNKKANIAKSFDKEMEDFW